MTRVRDVERAPGAVESTGGPSPASARPLGTGIPAVPASRPAMVAALARNELRLAARRGESLLITFVIPAGILVVFSAFDVTGGTAPGRPVDRALPGAIALAIIAASLVSLSIATGYERAYGVIKRLGGSPAGAGVVVAAKTAAVVAVQSIQVALLVGIAVALGWAPGPGASVAVFAAGLVAGTVAFAGLGLLLAGTLRAEATLALANLLFLLSLVLGGVVLPLERLPGPVAAIAADLPPATLTAVLASGLGGGGDPLEPLVILTVWAVALAALAAHRFRWD